ncbi:MAG TPA: PIN domain-containing protein [Solirubrobacter sp.]|nr:PIN domain-containing protein [Solirubrobacter sp.]
MTAASGIESDDSVLLDTDVFSVLFLNGRDAQRYDAAVAGREMLLSAFSQAEVLAGAEMRGWGERRLAALEQVFASIVILEVTEGVVRSYARVRALAKRLGHPLHGDAQLVDRWIAATALEYQVPLLTGNRKHYGELPGLRLVEVP